jgi:tetratricopeptide (TPR) repeat protein
VDRLLVDFDMAGRVSVSTWLDGEVPGAVDEPVELAWPLDAGELEDLRWYLEDYLRAPFGVYGERGSQVADRLLAWGRAMFTALFGSGLARDAYIRIRTRAGRGSAEIVLRSAAPRWLGLPWELLCEPRLSVPLALDGVGLSRSLPGAELSDPFDVGGQRLRVLMVISRPGGARDVGYRMIARPLLRRLEAVGGQVELKVLRPPTLEALAAELRAARRAGAPFQIVHFDGHGKLTGDPAGRPLGPDAPAEQGVLMFERSGGGADPVPAGRVAQVLAEERVPVVVLNACQSGAVGKRLEAAVATQLLAGGASAVVAMAYKVYTVAAAEFMTAFYERLFAGDTISDAVRAGRMQMAQRPGRPSPKGVLPLADWAVPVHYLRHEVRFPQLRTEPAARAGMSLEDALDRLCERRPDRQDDPLDPDGEFVGRDGLFYALEAAARTNRVVVIYGPAGTGKTELAKAFGRWWRDTGGVDRPEWVLWHVFEPGVVSFGLDGVISSIGLGVFGADFALKDPDSRRELVHNLLRKNRLLLIWDNFESVASMPDPASATPPLDGAGRRELNDFLHLVAAGGRSAILVTSRTPENWLGRLARLAIGGLTYDEAVEYADHLLKPLASARARRADRAFGELLEWLHGHPLSMRLILPHLEVTDAAALLAGLRGTSPLPADLGDGRTSRLPASITYSITHLNEADRRLLIAVSLFHGIAAAVMLGAFSRREQAPQRFRGIDTDRWLTLLERAAHLGLLTALGQGVYGIHPALPAYLAGQWRAEDPDAYPRQRAAAERALLDVYTGLGLNLSKMIRTGDAAHAYRTIGLERRTMGHLLAYALDKKLWDHAGAILGALQEYWRSRGLTEEARSWFDRAMLTLEASHGLPPPLGQPAGELWLQLIDEETRRLIRAGHLDAAESACTQALDVLLTQPDVAQQRKHIAAVYRRLGDIVKNRERLDDAEQWHRKALTIAEDLADRDGMAWTFRDLGRMAQRRRRWGEAEQWYRRSLAITEELGHKQGMALALIDLGDLAQEQGQLDDVERWHRKALTITEDHNLELMANSLFSLGSVAERRGQLDVAEQLYHQCLTVAERQSDQPARQAAYFQLGRLARARGQLDDAQRWYHQSLAIAEDRDDQLAISRSYLHLGDLAHIRRQLDDAQRWYHQSLAIAEDLGDQFQMVQAYHLLGQVAQELGRWDEAEQWYRKCLTIEEELGFQLAMAFSYGQLGRLAGDRGDGDGALTWTIRSVALFGECQPPTPSPALAQLAHLAKRFSTRTIERRWAEITSVPLPPEVREFVEAYEYSAEPTEDG